MKKIIVTVVFIIAGVILFFSFRGKEDEKIAYDTFVVKKGSISKTITATGTVEPITQVEIGTQVSGTIARIHVDFNDEVKKGQLLAELDRTVLESELASQTATLESNRNEFEYQKKNYERVARLYGKGLISDSEFETSEYQYKRAKQAYEKSSSDLVKAKTNLGYAMIYSPIDGVVLSRTVDEGQTVAAMFNTPKLFSIANDLKRMQVVANVDEADIGQVVEGQKVLFAVDAFPDDEFEGSVMQVRLEPTTTSNVVTYEVVIDAPNPDLKLKPGLTANITVYTMQKDDVLLLPLRALRFQPAGRAVEQSSPQERKTVWEEKGITLEPRPVKTGLSDGIYVEVVQGVEEGNKIVTGLRQENMAKDSDTKAGSPFMPMGGGKKTR